MMDESFAFANVKSEIYTRLNREHIKGAKLHRRELHRREILRDTEARNYKGAILRKGEITKTRFHEGAKLQTRDFTKGRNYKDAILQKLS